MGYRIQEPHHEPPRRTMEASSTPNDIYVERGTITHVAIPVWYLELKKPIRAHIHDRDIHDHLGWPAPDHPDHSCQSTWHIHHSDELAHRHSAPWRYDHDLHGWRIAREYLDYDRVAPIHLSAEGYTTIEVALEGNIVTAQASIDEKDDYIIRLSINSTSTPKGDKFDQDVKFRIYANGSFDGRAVKHLVTKGTIHVME